MERYLAGWFTAVPQEHCDTMAQAVPGTRAQRRQALLAKHREVAWGLRDQAVG